MQIFFLKPRNLKLQLVFRHADSTRKNDVCVFLIWPVFAIIGAIRRNNQNKQMPRLK